MPSADSFRLLDVRVDPVDWPEIIDFCRLSLQGDQPRHIVTVNGEQILLAQQDQTYREIINQSDLVIPDSTNVVWLAKLKGYEIGERTPGSELTLKLAELAITEGSRVFLLGGRNGVADLAAKKLEEMYPGINIVGTSENDPTNGETAGLIKSKNADIVLVAYGAPKHDYWIQQNKVRAGAKLYVGIGGTFDMLAGRFPRAPKFLQNLHLEWFWRLLLQPSRFKRIWNAVIVFPLKVIFS